MSLWKRHRAERTIEGWTVRGTWTAENGEGTLDPIGSVSATLLAPDLSSKDMLSTAIQVAVGCQIPSEYSCLKFVRISKMTSKNQVHIWFKKYSKNNTLLPYIYQYHPKHVSLYILTMLLFHKASY